MIWAVVSKEEMENYKIPPIFKYYREAIGKENIQLAVVDENDELSFVDKNTDIILLRSDNEKIINKIKDKRLISTAEDYSVYKAVKDKKHIAQLLKKNNILAPKQYAINDVENGTKYFVKPRFGSESFGITKDCICSSKEEVLTQIERIKKECNQEPLIEEFIEGVDCTVSVIWNPDTSELETYPIKVETDEIGGVQTHKGKFDYDEYCSALSGKEKKAICEISRNVFKLIGAKHHGRIDFRMTKDGEFYLIDINLLAGLGPTAHLAKCMLLTENKSYRTAIWSVIKSAFENIKK